jgi:hypothetical protein
VCLCELCTTRFLRTVAGTAVFRAYCRARQIPLPKTAVSPTGAAAWAKSLAAVPRDRRERIGAEVAAVHELGGGEGVLHLIEASRGAPPPPAAVPDGAPLALWFLLHRPETFWEVYLHHEPREADLRFVGRAAAGLSVPGLPRRAGALAAALTAFFRAHDGTGRTGAATAYRIPDGVYVAVRVSRRRHREERWPGTGERARGHLPAATVTFAYSPRDGTILLRAPIRSPEAVRDLLACFGRAFLRAPVTPAAPGFALERLRRPFHPLPDAEDMEFARVAAVRLQSTARAGRRGLNLETSTSDGAGAVDELLAVHATGDAADGTRVAHAVLQVRLRVRGRGKNYLVRLWPDRCDVGPGPVGDRLLACLRRWGL